MATPMSEATGRMEEGSSSSDSSSVPGYTDVNDFSQKALRTVLRATRGSNDLPVGDDFDFYSTFRSVRDVLDIESKRILTLLKRLLRSQNVRGNLSHGDAVELDDQFDVLMDANDQILERVGSLLDEASGVRKEETKLVIASMSVNQSKSAPSWNKKTPVKSSSVSYSLMTARNIQRPQLKFKDKIDNTSLPFRPQLKNKPNALRPLEDSLRLPDGVQPEDVEKPDFKYPNPYQTEIESFIPGPERLQHSTPKEPLPLNLTPLIMVTTESQLADMVADLAKKTEIAVDLEHHSYRSFQGLTCLMQISTRSHDYIIDTIELRSHLHVLNDVFTDPKVVKVLHGADKDIGWLQRDFGVYVVNMFDTGQAARVLNMARFSLAYLLMHYCQVEADKQFQLADWRIRPLPKELINYAREDTHFLLYIYDLMRNELLDKGNTTANLLISVYERSKTVAEKVYEKPVLQQDDHIELYKRSKKVFNNQQLAALRELYLWRDETARTEDESLGYVLPNHMLLQIAEILPREKQGVLACCNPVPPLVRQSLLEIHAMVMAAREVTLIKVEKRPVLEPSASQHPRYHIDSLLSCPHDTSHQADHAELAQVPDEGLMASTGSIFNATAPVITGVTLKASPAITAFAWDTCQQGTSSSAKQKADGVRACFSNPFTKFLPEVLRTEATVEPEDVWLMKPPTVKVSTTAPVEGNKRKLEEQSEQDSNDVDLNSFEPEFVPPAKRLKVTEADQPKAKSIFAVPSAPVSSQHATGGSAVAQMVEKKIKSMREEANKKKKSEKKALRAKEKLKKEKATGVPSSQDPTEVDPINSSQLLCPSSTSTPAAPPASSEALTSRQKKKKKKLTVDDVEANFSAFNYSAAQQNLQKQKKSKKAADIFNPALPSRSGKDKNKARKPKLSGPSSNKMVSFGPSVGGQGKKGKK